jgi:hypothetical protein
MLARWPPSIVISSTRSTLWPGNADEILRVLRAFQDADPEYVLISATAMAFRGVIRATEDVDLLVPATPENIERLRTTPAQRLMPEIRMSTCRRDSHPGSAREIPAVRYYPPQ